ncbi:hypothetical protein LXA43DRAFT_1068182 [Ganoderma leucocontextum]|nr:hypothetical protein LXA43DRAFT_1068182 [Ganoderma leucocontextum]
MADNIVLMEIGHRESWVLLYVHPAQPVTVQVLQAPCLPEALPNITRVTNGIDVNKWAKQDVDHLATIYGVLFSTFFSHLYHTLDGLPQIKPSDLPPYLSIPHIVGDSGVLERYDVDVNQRITKIQNQVRDVSTRFYVLKLQELQSPAGVNKALPLLLMTYEIEKNAKLLVLQSFSISYHIISYEWAYAGPADSGYLRAMQEDKGPTRHAKAFCSKLLLPSMYAQIEADDILAAPSTGGVVITEGLVPLDTSPSAKLDIFVTVTRAIYETLNPPMMAGYRAASTIVAVAES